MTSTEELKPGALFAGKYRIEGLVGKGGMSAVYEATNLMLQSRVALKVMSDELAELPEAVERFIREGIATSRVRHRAIVQVYDAGEHKGIPWIAMEFLDGESLNDRFARKGPLPPDEVVHIAIEVAAGLGAAHEHGVIHRDLKPHNIFLDKSQDPPQPKILDFGIAKLADAELAKLTQTGIMMGTPHYMSPEQAHGVKDIGRPADFWALGVIMLEAISGRMPFEAESVAAYLGQLVTAKPREVRVVAPDAPEALQRVIEWCLKTEPEARPQTARELITTLEEVAKELTENAPRPRTVPRPTEPSILSEAVLKPDTPPPPRARTMQYDDGADDAPRVEGDGALTGKPGVLPARPEASATIVSVPRQPSKKKVKRLSGPVIFAIIIIAVVLGATCTVAVGIGINRTLCAGEAPPPPEPVADETPPQEPPPPLPQTPAPAPDAAIAPPTLRPDSVLIDSDPRGAKVIVNGFDIGQQTPAMLPLRSTAHVELRLEGYISTSKIFQPGQSSLFFTLEKRGGKSGASGGEKRGKGFDDWAEHWRKQQTQGQ